MVWQTLTGRKRVVALTPVLAEELEAFGIADAEESGGLLKGLGAEAGDFQEFVAGFEGAVLVAEFHDALGNR